MKKALWVLAVVVAGLGAYAANVLATPSVGQSTTTLGKALAAEALTRESKRVRFDRSIHIPEDEICFFVFDAPSSQDAALVAERAGLDAVRIVEAISS